MEPADSKSRRPKAARYLVLAGLGVIVAGALAIGLGEARSDNPNQDKQDIENRIAATRAGAVLEAAQHPELIPTRSPGLKPTGTPQSWNYGILETGLSMFSPSEYIGRNGWEWDLDGNHVEVFAGAEGGGEPDPGRGEVIEFVMSMDLQPVPGVGGFFRAPPGTGILLVVSADGTLLTLQASTGETFYFDAESRSFTNADGSPVPADTPTPTPEPVPTGSPSETLPPIEWPTEEPTATAQPSATVAASIAPFGG